MRERGHDHWKKALGVVLAFFTTGALADGVLSLQSDDGTEFGIAFVTTDSGEACSSPSDWIDVTVGDLRYGSEIPDGSSVPDGTTYQPDSPSGQRSCDGTGAPGSLLRVDANTDFEFESGAVTLARTTGTYSGNAVSSGTYKVRPASEAGTAPEPGSLALFAIGLGAAGAAGIARHRRKRR